MVGTNNGSLLIKKLLDMATIQDQKLNVLERKEQIIYSHNFVVTLATALGQEDLI